MNIKADHPVDLPAILAGNGESNVVYIARRSIEGKLRASMAWSRSALTNPNEG